MKPAALVALLVVVVSAPAAPVPKALKAKRLDAEVFVGAWELVEGNNGGRQFIWTFDEDLTMWSKMAGANGPGTKWVIKIDPDQSPKHIDIGPDYKGIYEIDGDEIRIVYRSRERPANFDNQARVNYTILRRVK